MNRIIIISTLLILTSTAYSAPVKEQYTEINIAALRGPTALSMIKMIENRNNLDSNMVVNYHILNTPQLITAGILSGEYDIAAVPTNLASIIYNKKPDYQLAATTGYGTLYLLSSLKGIKSWQDLKDKTVYNIGRSSSPGFLFNYLLNENNIDPQNDLYIDFKYNHIELASLLISGKVDTGILPEPLVTKVLKQNSNIRVALDLQKEYKQRNSSMYPISCIIVDKKLTETDHNFINNFLDALEESINWVNDNPENAGELAEVNNLGVNGPIVKDAISRLNLRYKSAEQSKNELLEYYHILFKSNSKSIGGSLPNKDFFMSQR